MKKSKTAADQMIAGDIFVPGEYITEELDARGMKQVDLANELKLSKSEMSLIIHGKRKITIHIAINLERVFGIDAEFWMNLQIKYDIEKMKKEYSEALKLKGISTSRKNVLRKAIAIA